MAVVNKSIGSGKNYSTIAAWEDYTDGDPNNQNNGICEGEAFAAVTFAGGTYTATNYPHLTAKAGSEHDGRAQEVSAKGNARIEVSTDVVCIQINDEFVRVSWMEVRGPGANNYYPIYVNAVTTCTIHLHHLIVHNNYASTSGSEIGIYVNDVDASCYVYRNICYGHFGDGIEVDNASSTSVLFCNTLYYNGDDATYGAGIGNYVATIAIENNASLGNVHKGFLSTSGVLDYNATSDATGAEGAHRLSNLTTTDQFVHAGTMSTTDLLLKADADLIGAGVDLTSATYPEIEYPIHSRTVAVTGAWDIGADQYVPAAQNYTQTVNESLGVTDARTSLLALIRTVAESLGLTDAGTSLLALIRAIADSAGLTDGAAAVQGFARALSESLGTTDAAAAMEAFTRTVADAETLADNAGSVAAFARSVAEAEGLADVAGLVSAFVRAASENVGLSDAMTSAAVFARAVSDAAGLTDAVDQVAAYLRSLIETEGMTDEAAFALTGPAFLAAWFAILNRRNR